MKLFKQENHELTMVVLSYSIGAVFLWFGIDKWIHPEAWYGWLPGWLWPLLPGGDADLFLYANGAFEFVVGILLVSQRYLRLVAAAAGLFMFAIALTLGANEVTIRDNALVGACLALFLHANAKAKNPVAERHIRAICTAFVIFLFVYGVLYLRSAA
jgi:uncharacterized membrane protein YphA (DoxX/SURF4 family)